MKASNWLVDMVCHSGVGTSTLHFSSHGYVSHPTDTPPNTIYEQRITNIYPFGVSLFGESRTMGDFSVEKSGVSIENMDDSLSAYIAYGFDGRPVTIRRLLNPRDSLASSTAILAGTLEGMDSDSGMTEFRFRFYDRRRDLDKPLQQNFYGGTVLGTSPSIDGVPDQKDKPRPLNYGATFAVEGVLCNPHDLLIQIHDGPVYSIIAYDGGVPLTLGPDYATIALLQAATGNPGTYATCLAAGVWRPFGSFKGRPAFVWTADVLEGATSADRRAGAVTKRILAKMGQDGSIVDASFTALDAIATAEVGIYIDSETTALSAIREILGSVGGWIVPTNTGAFKVGRLDAPGTPTWTLVEPDIVVDGETDTIAFISNPDTDGNVPAPSVTIKYARNWHVYSDTEIAGTVAENSPARATSLQQEYVDSKVEDAAVLIKHLLARELIIETLIAYKADADTEAARRLGLYGVHRVVIRVMASLEDAETIELNSTGTIVFEGLGFNAGKPMVVIGREDDYQRERVVLTLWG